MARVPFNPYDFFGYMATGVLGLTGSYLVLGFPPVFERDLPVFGTAALLLATYVAGQLLATPAKALLEDLLVGRLLRRPSEHLLGLVQPRIGRLLFPAYCRPLPTAIRQHLRERFAEARALDGAAAFLHARYAPEILANVNLQERLSIFLNQYGFARNLSFASLLVGLAFVIRSCPVTQDLRPYGTALLVASVLLFYRFLKFYRKYCFELFMTYARST